MLSYDDKCILLFTAMVISVRTCMRCRLVYCPDDKHTVYHSVYHDFFAQSVIDYWFLRCIVMKP